MENLLFFASKYFYSVSTAIVMQSYLFNKGNNNLTIYIFYSFLFLYIHLYCTAFPPTREVAINKAKTQQHFLPIHS